MANKSRNVAIIGLGTFGVSVARELTRMGDNVLGIDDNPARVSMICDEIKSSIQVDATDDKALSQCALETYDAVLVSIGENTEASILTAMNVMELGCKQVWVKAQTETQRKILKAIGVHHVVLPEQRFGTHIAQIIHNPYVDDFMSLGDGQYVVMMEVHSSLAGKLLKEFKFEKSHNISCMGVYTDCVFSSPAEFKDALKENDKIILFGTRSQLRKFSDAN
ncbi:TrkA family potassium uptake protein [Fretibacter rubidus]|uniref:potassium channel family protein n=1 Tax=Fretibacter rubidus TaxID=570162 RepID=UPI00352B6B50